jgi:hypothetical protein
MATPDESRPTSRNWVLGEGGADQASTGASATIRVSEKLRRRLSILTGAIGFNALQARALALAKVQLKSLDHRCDRSPKIEEVKSSCPDVPDDGSVSAGLVKADLLRKGDRLGVRLGQG